MLPEAEALRSLLLQNKEELTYDDPGAGSAVMKNNRTIADLARISSTPPAYAALYSRLAKWINARYIIELGTCLGLTTLYLNGSERKVYTFEGVPQLADLAQMHFEQFGASGIHIIRGNIDKTLRPTLENIPQVDFALVDANHLYQPTIHYTELLIKKAHNGTVIVIDDIHLNKEMETAWSDLRRHPLVYCSVDLFRCGMLFFSPSVNRQHVVLQF